MSGASKQANERTDERVAQYSSLYFWLFWTIVSDEFDEPFLVYVSSVMIMEGLTDECCCKLVVILNET